MLSPPAPRRALWQTAARQHFVFVHLDQALHRVLAQHARPRQQWVHRRKAVAGGAPPRRQLSQRCPQVEVVAQRSRVGSRLCRCRVLNGGGS